MKVLFVCAANMSRSPTAETMLSVSEDYEVKSAGMSVYSRVPITQELVDWADTVFVMETWMKRDLLERFKVPNEKVIVLHVRDMYHYGHPLLVDILAERLAKHGIKVDIERAEEKFIEAELKWGWTERKPKLKTT